MPLGFVLPKTGEIGEEPLPRCGRDIIEVFTMGAKAVQTAAQNPSQRQAMSLGDELAIYTTFCWLLEQHQQALEGPQGTGSLAKDIEIIQCGPDGVSLAYWNCVVYRAGQKSIVRKYLKAARRKVQHIMDDMHSHRYPLQ